MTTTIQTSKIAILITAAGSSTRMGGGIKKEFLPLGNGTVLSGCARTFLNACQKNFLITDFIITCKKGMEDEAKKALSSIDYKNFTFVSGGSTRQESVFKGLLEIEKRGKMPDIVLVHDGARPFVSERIILEGIRLAKEFGASVPGLTPTDTQKEISPEGFIKRHLVRSSLFAVQTPQNFKFKELLEAHKKASEETEKAQKEGIKKEFTDDTEIWGQYCGKVKVYQGEAENIKITYPGDLKTQSAGKI